MISRHLCFCSIILLTSFLQAHAKQTSVRFCIDAENTTVSSRSLLSINTVNLSEEIAKKLHLSSEVVWVNVPMRGGIFKAIKKEFKNNTCDVFFGIPVEQKMLSELSELGISVTKPYLSVGYVAISTREKSDDLKENNIERLRFGASSASPADLFLLHNQLNRSAYNNHQDLLEALRRNMIDIALVWSPLLDPQETDLEEHQDLISSLKFYEPLIWNLTMAINPTSKVSIDDINAALQSINKLGELSIQPLRNNLVDFEFNRD